MDDLRKKEIMIIKDNDVLETQDIETAEEEVEEEVCAACMIHYSNEK